MANYTLHAVNTRDITKPLYHEWSDSIKSNKLQGKVSGATITVQAWDEKTKKISAACCP